MVILLLLLSLLFRLTELVVFLTVGRNRQDDVIKMNRMRHSTVPIKRTSKRTKPTSLISNTAVQDVLWSTMKQNRPAQRQYRRRMTLNSLEAEYAEQFLFSTLSEQTEATDSAHRRILKKEQISYYKHEVVTTEQNKENAMKNADISNNFMNIESVHHKIPHRSQPTTITSSSDSKEISLHDIRRRLNDIQRFIDLHRSMIDHISLSESKVFKTNDHPSLHDTLLPSSDYEDSVAMAAPFSPVSAMADELLIKIESLRRKLRYL
jgi:hypothetical protein